jgi:antitoxin YefM
MRTVALSEAKDKLSALVDEAARTHEVISITRHGHAAAVLMAAEDLESLRETIRVLSTPGALDELKEARAAYKAGDTVSGDEMRRRYGLTGQ